MLSVTVVHVIPGRVRLRVPELRRDPSLAERIIAVGMAHPGVRQVRVNLACASVVIEGEPRDRAEMEALVRQWATTRTNGVEAAPPRDDVPAWRRLLPLGMGIGALVLSFLTGGVAPGLAVAATAVSAIPIVVRAVSGLWVDRRPTVDLLDASAVVLMLALSDVRSAALMCALVAFGEEIRERTARRSQRAVLDLRQALGRSAWVVQGNRKVHVPIEELRRGDVVAVYTGDLVPVDGLVVDGDATVDQKTLTGESRGIYKTNGDRVLAATAVTDGKLYIRAEAVGSATRAGLVVHALQTAPTFDTRMASYANQFADRLVLPTIGLAAALWLATGSMARAASVLILDFATGIRVSAPTSVLATMTRAARRGILIKSGRSIEKLAAVDVVIFDKTGTLTRGKPRVSNVLSMDEAWDPDDVLALAAAAELRLRHPSARALVRHARRRRVHIPERESSNYTTGQGVIAVVEGHTVRVGSARFFAEAGISTERGAAAVQRAHQQGNSCVFVGIDQTLAGIIAYYDPARPQARPLVSWLHVHGVHELYMVTGDDLAAAEPIASALGVDHVRAGVMPDEKAAIVAELQRRGHTVAVVGDGINDSPALALADVSISLKSGADIARETADVVLMKPRKLMRIAEAIQLSRDCVGLIQQNVAIVAAPNAVALGLAATVGLSPVASTILNNGSSIVAAINSLRPLMADGAPRSGASLGNR